MFTPPNTPHASDASKLAWSAAKTHSHTCEKRRIQLRYQCRKYRSLRKHSNAKVKGYSTKSPFSSLEGPHTLNERFESRLRGSSDRNRNKNQCNEGVCRPVLCFLRLPHHTRVTDLSSSDRLQGPIPPPACSRESNFGIKIVSTVHYVH